MIYAVHSYYGKCNSRKRKAKIEAIVFANSSQLAEELVKKMFKGCPVDFEYLDVTGGMERDLSVIYAQRPELREISPDNGYIYNEFFHINEIHRYFR